MPGELTLCVFPGLIRKGKNPLREPGEFCAVDEFYEYHKMRLPWLGTCKSVGAKQLGKKPYISTFAATCT